NWPAPQTVDAICGASRPACHAGSPAGRRISLLPCSFMSDPLFPDFRALAHAALDRIAAYYDTLPARPTIVPTTSTALRDLLAEPLPQDPAPFDTLLDQLDATVFQYSRHNAHPRFF